MGTGGYVSGNATITGPDSRRGNAVVSRADEMVSESTCTLTAGMPVLDEIEYVSPALVTMVSSTCEPPSVPTVTVVVCRTS
jgi:hypothetical protein